MTAPLGPPPLAGGGGLLWQGGMTGGWEVPRTCREGSAPLAQVPTGSHFSRWPGAECAALDYDLKAAGQNVARLRPKGLRQVPTALQTLLPTAPVAGGTAGAPRGRCRLGPSLSRLSADHPDLCVWSRPWKPPVLEEGLGAPVLQRWPLLLRRELIRALSHRPGSTDGGCHEHRGERPSPCKGCWTGGNSIWDRTQPMLAPHEKALLPQPPRPP